MLTRMNNLMVLLVSWLGMMLVYNGDTIDMKRTVQYKQIQKLPSDECKIGDISAIPALPICLIRCSEEADCLTVVYEGNTCSWYKSCELVHDKGPEQEIMTKTEVETITRKSMVLLWCHFDNKTNILEVQLKSNISASPRIPPFF